MPVTIDRLHMAKVTLPGKFNPPTHADTRIDVFGYLIRSDSLVILVDTGVGIGNDYIEATFQPVRSSLIDELARCEVELADVDVIVNSHLHYDHCGRNQLIPGAEVFIQEAELQIARRLKTRYTVPTWFDFDGARIHPVRGDEEIVTGVKMLFTPGHTPGHQSLLVASESGPIVVAAQAAFTAEEFHRGGDPKGQAHEGLEHEYVESIARLKSIGAERVLFSHDSAQCQSSSQTGSTAPA